MKLFNSIAFKTAFPLFLVVVVVSVLSMGGIYWLQSKQLKDEVQENGDAILHTFINSSRSSLEKGQRKTFQDIIDNTASLKGVLEASVYDRKGLKLYKSGEVTVGKPFVHKEDGTFKNPNKKLYEESSGQYTREDWYLRDVSQTPKALKHQQEMKEKGHKSCTDCHFMLDDTLRFDSQGKASVVKGDISHHYYQIKVENDCVKCHTHWKKNESAGVLAVSVDNSSQISRMNLMIAEFGLAFVITGICIILMILYSVGRIKKRLNELNNGVRALASGSADILEIEDADEIGDIASSFNTYIDTIKLGQEQDEKLIQATAELAKTVKEGKLQGRIDLDGNNPQLNELKRVLNEMLDTLQSIIGKDIHIIMEALQNYSHKDFTTRIDDAKGELEKLVNSLGDDMTSQLMVSLNNASVLQEDAKMLTKSIDTLRDSANKQTNSIVETSATMDQMSSAITALSDRTSQIVSQSEEIKSVVSMISDIAEQTNLLALNAAIEAARAGEHGRGFAVVADEVRKLAEKTQKSLAEINATINVLVQSINDAGSDIEEQASGVEHVNGEITGLKDMIQANSDATQNTTEVSSKLEKLSEQIIKEVNENKINK